MSRPLASWIVAAVALIVAETLVVSLLRRVASGVSPGVVYLVGVLVVSSVSGPALGVVTAVLSAAAFGFFYVPPSLDFVASDPLGRAALTIVLAVALVHCSVAALARLLRTHDLRCALPDGSGRLARALRPSAAAIGLQAVAGEERRAAFPLRDGGTLLVPADQPQTTERRMRGGRWRRLGRFCVWRAIARGWGAPLSGEELRVVAGEP